MKIKYLLLLFALIGITCYFSCRKADLQQLQELPTKPASPTEEKFFNSNRSTDVTEKVMADFIKKENSQRQFVEKTVEKIGYPRWDKALLIKKPATIIANRGESSSSDSTTLYYIPFVRDSQRYVNASLLIKVEQGDTTFHYLCDWQYSNMEHGAVTTDTTAERYALFFMMLDKRTFGYTEFNISDMSLFPAAISRAGGGKKLGFKNSAIAGRTFNRMQIVQVCAVAYVCGDVNWCTNHGGCDYENCVADEGEPGHCYSLGEVCEDFWVDDGGGDGGTGDGGGNGGSGGSGDGGSGNGDTPPDCEPTGGRTAGRLMNGTPCEPGWEIFDEAPPYISPIDSLIAENLKKAYLKAKQTADAQHTAAQQDGKERAFSYQILNNDTVVYNIVIGDKQSSHPSTGSSIFGLNHTHQDNGLPAANSQSDANQTFDTDDIFKFYSDQIITAGSKTLTMQTITTRDYVYAAYITDINLFKANMISQAGTSLYKAMPDNLYYKYDSLLKSCTAPPACTYERQSELALLGIFGNNSGIKFFKSQRNIINFIKL